MSWHDLVSALIMWRQ